MSSEHYQRYDDNPWQASNQNVFVPNSYQQVHQKTHNEQLSLQQEPSIQYEYTEKYIVVRSEDRDISNYPQPQSYRIELENSIRNIHSIELIEGYIPDKNNVTQEPYLLLDIPELRDQPMECINKDIANSFAILQMSPPVTAGYFIWFDKRTHENTIKYYKNTKARINAITIHIRDHQGNLFNFGDDTSGTPPNKPFQNMFVFKIVTKEKNHDTLNYRTVH
jgi:hypothetical protein